MNYQDFWKLPKEERKKRVSEAQQSEAFSKPHPLGDHKFPELRFIEFYISQGNEKIRLETYRYLPKQPSAKGLIFMFHGLNNYIGRGAHIADFFSKNGFIVVGFDHRGFGRSEGKGGYIENLNQHLEDSRLFIQKVLSFQEYGKLPRFILGQSMGGLTAYSLTLKEPHLFDGVIMMAPALKNQISQFKRNLTKTLNFLLPKKLVLPKPQMKSSGTRNPQVTKANRHDNYVFRGWVSVWTLQVLIKAMEEAPKTFVQYSAPFMVIQGGLDKVVNSEGAFELYENSCTAKQEKQILFYEEMWHNVWHEEQIFDILDKILPWISKRMSKKMEKNDQKMEQPMIKE